MSQPPTNPEPNGAHEPAAPAADQPGAQPQEPAQPAVPREPAAAHPPAVHQPVTDRPEQGQAPAVLDEGTYPQLREPRSAGRLALDGTWHQISPKYVVSELLQYGITLVVVVVATLVLGLVLNQAWAWFAGGAVLVVLLWTLIILPRQARAYGYRLRDDDIVFRRGILWQRIVAVPYGRMQLVDVTHGPLDRAFGIAKLKLVTAAAATGVEIPGLTQRAAETLRDTLIEVAETRRTGL